MLPVHDEDPEGPADDRDTANTADQSPAAVILGRVQDEVAEIFGNIATFWGFTRTQGRVYGLLFLSPEPLGHKDIQARLQISAGSTSMTLSSLLQWAVIRRRERFYEAETDMWKVITGVMRRRERDQVNEAIERMDRVAELLRAGPSVDTDPRLAFARARVEQLLHFFELGRKFLDAFVNRNPLRTLLSTIATRAAKFRPLMPLSERDAPIGH